MASQWDTRKAILHTYRDYLGQGFFCDRVVRGMIKSMHQFVHEKPDFKIRCNNGVVYNNTLFLPEYILPEVPLSILFSRSHLV